MARRIDAVLVLLAAGHAALLVACPTLPVVALGLWWNANTVSHNFVHNPFFRGRAANAVFSAFLSLLLGVPQSVWGARHRAHHADEHGPVKWTAAMAVETGLVLGLWTFLASLEPRFFLAAYLPGWLLGLTLCFLQGHFEHHRGTVSHYGWLYNTLFLNDGYHVEHHADPQRHWMQLPRHRLAAARSSLWPALLRGLEVFTLEGLERLALRSRILREFVLETHERAFRRLLRGLPPARRVGIVGGGLFPRTAMVLRRVAPEARLSVIDLSAENLKEARAWVGEEVEFRHERFDPGQGEGFDLLVLPLDFRGDREAVCRAARVPVLVHDWIWRGRGRGTVVSAALLKRLNLVLP